MDMTIDLKDVSGRCEAQVVHRQYGAAGRCCRVLGLRRTTWDGVRGRTRALLCRSHRNVVAAGGFVRPYNAAEAPR